LNQFNPNSNPNPSAGSIYYLMCIMRGIKKSRTPHRRDTRKWSDDYRTRTRTMTGLQRIVQTANLYPPTMIVATERENTGTEQ